MTRGETPEELERRIRRAAVTAATGRAPEGPDDREPDDEQDDDAALRLEQKALWVDMQVRRAIDRGEFDNLPGIGKPIPGLGGTHDPDWWAKQLIEREQITGVLPPALALRKEDAQLDAVLDRENTEAGVRQVLDDFNFRVVEARRQLLGGPPVVTPTRDPDAEITAWRERRAQRRERQRRLVEQMETERSTSSTSSGARRRWGWLLRSRGRPGPGSR